jgi:hypothetical protein
VIDAGKLLSDLQAELGRLVADLNQKVRDDADVRARIEAEWRSAFDANRTGRTFEDWADDRLTQVAVAWLLACVFVRYCEDNGLIDEARIAGPGIRDAEARDAQQRYFTGHPHSNDREYLQSIFRSAATFRGLDEVVGEGESPLWLVDPPADAATRLLGLFRSTDESGSLAHDFTDLEMGTRFLGDLYQDLSDYAKSTYDLLQTPDFIEEFILDRTLTPAIETFGLAKTTLIDPTCGSGHFLLGGFQRLFGAWRVAEPGGSEREHAERALAAVTGVDLNPFAAAIARFRLLVAALKASRVARLADAPVFEIDVAVGDSLLWGPRPGQFAGMEAATAAADRQFLYRTEHADALQRIFNKQYTAVVGNPPYRIARDKALNTQYRDRFPLACSGKYSLAAPFMQRFFDLAVSPDILGRPAGFVGMITANSFMKREFGKTLVENCIPNWDLTQVIDTGSLRPEGHTTPTVILFGRNQRPIRDALIVVSGIKGEQPQPADLGSGRVWKSILSMVDVAPSENEFISVAWVDRSRLARHPWSIGGGGAAELKDLLDSGQRTVIATCCDSIGFHCISGEDDFFLNYDRAASFREGLLGGKFRPLGVGENVRDWGVKNEEFALFPYDDQLFPIDLSKLAWPYRRCLEAGLMFGKTKEQRGLRFTEYAFVSPDREFAPLLIAFAFVATHNHFVLSRGDKVFNRSAPVMKLPQGATVDDHLMLLGLLNSSTACFWMHQVFSPKPNPGDDLWQLRFEHDGTKLQQFPLPAAELPLDLARTLDSLGADFAAHQPLAVCADGVPFRARLDEARAEADRIFSLMISLQEELDWHCLRLYSLTEESLTVPEGETPPPLNLGERAFEVILARQVEAGQAESAWFTRHGSTPITELPDHWPTWYADLVERRIDLIERDRDVALVERLENKRRWAREPWEKLETEALETWLLDRLEDRRLWFEGSGDGERAVCRSIAQLADKVIATDPDFLEVARVWRGVIEVDPVAIVAGLVAEAHVPAQAAARYKGKGLDTRRQWERTWDLQRLEDRGQPLPDGLARIPVPPKYGQADFAAASYWKQRGKLDVPKERFTSVAGAEGDVDPTMVLAWAGFDHAQIAQAIGTLLMDRQQNDGWDADRSWPLVVAMAELLPWLAQWHADVDPRLGDSPAGLYRAFTEQQALAGERTLADAPDWRPTAATRGRKRKGRT